MLLKTVRQWLLVISIGMICLGTMFFWLLNRPTHADSFPDTPEAYEVMRTLNQFYDALDTAYATGNLDVLPEVLIDHPDYQEAIDSERQAKVKAYISEILGPAAAQNFGYLTVMKNKLTHRLQGRQLLKSALAKAKAENRELTEAEMQALAKQNHGVLPSLPEENVSRKGGNMLEKEQFRSIEINDDKARVVFERVAIHTALLVRVNGRWYVAGIF